MVCANSLHENGACCLEMCRGSDIVVMNGWFSHKKVHKMTHMQRMGDQRDLEAILDYCIVSKECSGRCKG